jgi:hypothetical protein
MNATSTVPTQSRCGPVNPSANVLEGTIRLTCGEIRTFDPCCRSKNWGVVRATGSEFDSRNGSEEALQPPHQTWSTEPPETSVLVSVPLVCTTAVHLRTVQACPEGSKHCSMYVLRGAAEQVGEQRINGALSFSSSAVAQGVGHAKEVSRQGDIAMIAQLVPLLRVIAIWRSRRRRGPDRHQPLPFLQSLHSVFTGVP